MVYEFGQIDSGRVNDSENTCRVVNGTSELEVKSFDKNASSICQCVKEIVYQSARDGSTLPVISPGVVVVRLYGIQANVEIVGLCLVFTVRHVKVLKNEGCIYRCRDLLVSELQEDITGYLLVSWWFEFYGIQAKMEIIGFLSRILGFTGVFHWVYVLYSGFYWSIPLG